MFTGIAVSTLSSADSTSATLIQGTITAAAVIHELIEVVLAKVGFTKAGEPGKAEIQDVKPTDTDSTPSPASKS